MTMYRTKHSITGREYTGLEAAFDFYNERLFSGALPPCLITYQRKANAQGYFSRARFESRAADAVADGATDEIALNPDVFGRKTDREILSTLVHEMAHLEQYHFGNPGRKGYHNAEWAGRMETLGLMPSSTGQPGGRRTGQSMTHYIADGGPFDVATAELLATGWRLNWQSPAGQKKTRDPSKTKFTCNCGQAAWGKPGAWKSTPAKPAILKPSARWRKSASGRSAAAGSC